VNDSMFNIWSQNPSIVPQPRFYHTLDIGPNAESGRFVRMKAVGTDGTVDAEEYNLGIGGTVLVEPQYKFFFVGYLMISPNIPGTETVRSGLGEYGALDPMRNLDLEAEIPSWE